MRRSRLPLWAAISLIEPAGRKRRDVPRFRPRAFAILMMAWSSLSGVGAQAQGLDQIVAPGTTLERLPGEYQFTEGPVWMPAGFLVWSDIPANRLWRTTADGRTEVFREPSGHANGNALDLAGRLLTCQHDRRLVRSEENGELKVLAERFEGKRLNSPNDLAVRRSDGAIYFTDPPYGLNRKAGDVQELDFQGVYRLTADGTLALLVRDFNRPNGIAFSPDQKQLYVADTEKRHVRIFGVNEDGSLDEGRIFVEVPNPDGIKVDAEGNLYCGGPKGVTVFRPSGELIGLIETPNFATNCCFGDSDGRTLFITAGKHVYRIRLKVRGAL